MDMAKEMILVVDDEESMRDFLSIMLGKEGYSVRAFPGGGPALEFFKNNRCDLVITDLRMPGMNGVEFLKEIKALDAEVPVVMVTAYASVDTAIDAMKSGAYDYFTKPFKVEEIKHLIGRALERRRLVTENLLLKQDYKSKHGFCGIVGESKPMKEVYHTIMTVAPTRSNVFITGKSGTGKELVARAIHDESQRRDKPFVALNCGAIPHSLIESELFGHQRGAFTGAVSNKDGLVVMADGGTFFLDEVTELDPDMQVKLLRFIQERNFRRVGGTTDISVDVRIVAASNRDLEEEVRLGSFREDLFYRLNVIRIFVPSLGERKEDIPLLARSFIEKYCREMDKNIKGISGEAMKILLAHDYSGNVRELENIIEHAVVIESAEEIGPESLPPSLTAAGESLSSGAPTAGDGQAASLPPGGIDLERAVMDFEESMIMEALERTDGVKTKAAELLGLSFRSFRYKLGKYEKRED